MPKKVSFKIKRGEIVKMTGLKTCTRDRIRELVRIRDRHTCLLCKKQWMPNIRRFDVHHLDKKFEGKTLSVTKQDRPNTHRMITLCHKCHLNMKHIRKKMSLGH